MHICPLYQCTLYLADFGCLKSNYNEFKDTEPGHMINQSRMTICLRVIGTFFWVKQFERCGVPKSLHCHLHLMHAPLNRDHGGCNSVDYKKKHCDFRSSLKMSPYLYSIQYIRLLLILVYFVHLLYKEMLV